MRRFVILALIGLLAGCASGRLKVGPTEDGEVVEAEGWSPIDDQDLLGTKQRSLAEAQKKAVEKVVGVYISAKTRVSQAVSVNQNILADVKGYIKKYEVIGEKREEGFHKTRIRALVRFEQVGKDLDRLGLIRPDAPPGNPRVMVRMQAAGGGGEPAAAAVRKALIKRGFSVVDSEQEAEIIVRGEVEAHALKIENVNLGGFHSFRARITLEALKMETNEVVAGGSKEASGLDAAPSIAEGKALESAGFLAAEALAEELHALLSRRVDISLRVLGMRSLEEVQRLLNDLRTQPDIALAALASYGAEKTALRVTTEGFTGEQLAALLQDMKRYKFKTMSITPYQVEVRVEP
ncbi:MAG: hypothetical protein ABIJ96_11715 [Elusimicrobiota bacterium]